MFAVEHADPLPFTTWTNEPRRNPRFVINSVDEVDQSGDKWCRGRAMYGLYTYPSGEGWGYGGHMLTIEGVNYWSGEGDGSVMFGNESGEH